MLRVQKIHFLHGSFDLIQTHTTAEEFKKTQFVEICEWNMEIKTEWRLY